jgi:hypothetical protein
LQPHSLAVLQLQQQYQGRLARLQHSQLLARQCCAAWDMAPHQVLLPVLAVLLVDLRAELLVD